MKIKTLVLIATAAFALGSGMSASAVQFNPFQRNGAGCLACYNNCEAAYNGCIAAGTSVATCVARATLCRRACGCPVPP